MRQQTLAVLLLFCKLLPAASISTAFIQSSLSHLQAHKGSRGCKQQHSAGSCLQGGVQGRYGEENRGGRGFPWSYSQVMNAKWGMAAKIPSVELEEMSSLVQLCAARFQSRGREKENQTKSQQSSILTFASGGSRAGRLTDS